MTMDSMLIAETDDQGAIVCVWQADHGSRPRPVKDAAACLSAIGTFSTYGAARSEILRWLTDSAAELG